MIDSFKQVHDRESGLGSLCEGLHTSAYYIPNLIFLGIKAIPVGLESNLLSKNQCKKE